MKRLVHDRIAIIVGVSLLTLALVLLAGCAVDAGEGYGGDGGYVSGYYEPFGYDYGGWGGGYRVGPPRGGERGNSRSHSYRSAPASRPTPSIPSRGGRSPGGARR